MCSILIFNPTSGSSMIANSDGETPAAHEQTILEELRAHNIEPEVWHTTEEDSGKGLAQKASEEGADLVIAAGGDGTIHAVASGLIGSKSTLGIIALGTMNNIARSLSIPESIAGACAIIGTGETEEVDVGKINEHVFLEVAGIGLEAALFPAAEEIKNSSWLSSIRGFFSGLYTLFTFPDIGFKVSFDGHRSHSYRGLQVTVCNTPYYGVHFQVAPSTLMDDGLLDVVVYKNFSKLEYVRHSISILQGRRVLEPKITRRKVKALFVKTDHPVEIHADGVPKGTTPATITIIPGALRVRIPQKVAAGPNMIDTTLKKKQQSEQTKNNERFTEKSEEEGSLHVK